MLIIFLFLSDNIKYLYKYVIAVCLTSCYLNSVSVALQSISIFFHVLQLKIDPTNSAKVLLQGLVIA